MHRTGALWLGVLLAIGSVPRLALAQPPAAAFSIRQSLLVAGRCTVVVDIPDPLKLPSAEIDIDLNGMWIAREPVGTRKELAFLLRGPLAHMDVVRAREVGPNRLGDWSAPQTVAAGDGEVSCKPPDQKETADDQRDPFSATAYIGAAFDNFSPAEVGTSSQNSENGYINPRAGGSSTQTVAGVNFEFRALGGSGSRVQFWLAGETLHGVKSADVDCTNDDPAKRPPLCGTVADILQKPPSATFLYILEHASSFEAFLEPRLEFATLQAGTVFPSRFYATFRFGVNMLSDEAHKAFDAFHFGVGLLSPSGPFNGSYLELGWGRTDLFFNTPGRNPWHRLKIDGLLSFPVLQAFTDKAKFWTKAPRAFVQIYSDFDPRGNESDSIQTFVGLDFDLGEIFKW